MDARYWDLAAFAVMIVALLTTSALHYVVIRWLNSERDAAVTGVRAGEPLTLTHRWQVFFDWVAMLTGLVGITAAMVYAFLSIATMAETQSVRWFGYLLAGLSGWTLLMLALVAVVSDGMLIVRTLRAQKKRGKVGATPT